MAGRTAAASSRGSDRGSVRGQGSTQATARGRAIDRADQARLLARTRRGGGQSRQSQRARSQRRPVRRPLRRRRGIVGAVGHGVSGAWNLLARGMGSVARAVGRTRELDPAHQRDGIALGLIAIAVVTAAGVWWNAGGPVGAWLDGVLRTAVGAAGG